MTTILTLYQGDSSDSVVATVYSDSVQVTDLVSNGYSATFSLVSSIGQTPVLNKNMSEVNNTFKVSLLSTDTGSITPGLYKGVTQVINSGLGYKKETHIDVRINPQGYIEA